MRAWHICVAKIRTRLPKSNDRYLRKNAGDLHISVTHRRALCQGMQKLREIRKKLQSFWHFFWQITLLGDHLGTLLLNINGLNIGSRGRTRLNYHSNV
jgi:hypothetical protein